MQDYQYGFFGDLKDQKNRIKQPYRYTGREWDKETGLYYYRARYYDATVGRFTQKDPIGFEGGINLYNYVGANSVNWIDPWGYSSFIVLGRPMPMVRPAPTRVSYPRVRPMTKPVKETPPPNLRRVPGEYRDTCELLKTKPSPKEPWYFKVGRALIDDLNDVGTYYSPGGISYSGVL